MRHPAFAGVFAINIADELCDPVYGDQLAPAAGSLPIAIDEDIRTAPK